MIRPGEPRHNHSAGRALSAAKSKQEQEAVKDLIEQKILAGARLCLSDALPSPAFLIASIPARLSHTASGALLPRACPWRSSLGAWAGRLCWAQQQHVRLLAKGT